VLKTPEGLVTDRRHTKGKELAEEGTDAYDACLQATGRRVFVGRDAWRPNGGGGGGFNNFQLRGRYLTFVYSYGSRYGTALMAVEQYDLRKGRRSFTATYDVISDGIELERQNVQAETDPRLKVVSATDGDAAWVTFKMGCWAVGCGVQAVSLVVHDRAGTRTVATYQMGPGDPYELRASEVSDLVITVHAVSWHHLAESRSVALSEHKQTF
jgi:hypothetical protein